MPSEKMDGPLLADDRQMLDPSSRLYHSHNETSSKVTGLASLRLRLWEGPVHLAA